MLVKILLTITDGCGGVLARGKGTRHNRSVAEADCVNGSMVDVFLRQLAAKRLCRISFRTIPPVTPLQRVVPTLLLLEVELAMLQVERDDIASGESWLRMVPKGEGDAWCRADDTS